jgi:beta-galactosidase
MIPHAGTTSRVWREVVELGDALGRLDEVRGSRVAADVAVLWDFESFWAQDLEWRPSVDVSHAERIRSFYERLWRDGITVDFALPGQDLSGYKLVVAPAQYLLSAADAANLTRYVASGGTLVVSFFSAVVDENDAVPPGGFVAPLREALGVVVEEFLPLREGARHAVQWRGAASLLADAWQEDVVLEGAEAVGTYLDGPGAGGAAITRHAHGAGVGWYLSTRLDAAALRTVMSEVYADAGIVPAAHPEGLEVVVRRGDGADFAVAINHRDEPAAFAATGVELLTGSAVDGTLTVPGGGVAVVRLEPTS